MEHKNIPQRIKELKIQIETNSLAPNSKFNIQYQDKHITDIILIIN